MLIIFFILVVLGIYLILSDIFKLPTLKKTKAISDAIKRDKTKESKSIELILLDIASNISKYIKIDDYKRDKLRIDLKSADINLTPETYLADVYIKTLICILVSFITLIINPIISIIPFIISSIVYVKELNKVNDILKRKRMRIENELPLFAITLEQELKSSRNILAILESYQKNSKTNLGKELQITIADMRSGSYEDALKRFETRIGSSTLSEIIRGLIGVLNGNDESLYFKMLAHDLRELEFQRLRKIAIKRPLKIKKYSAMMLMSLMLMYGVILSYEIINGLGSMF